MAALDIEQLLHGYRRGHEQIAGSVKLSAVDAELVTRLSDLSGSLSNAPEFDSYLTLYPLRSEQYFAVAKTWPDSNAPRAGCVLTHTLLVPMQIWKEIQEFRSLESLFCKPSSSSLVEFNSQLTRPIGEPDESELADRAGLRNFVRKYFGEGLRPIVWFSQREASEIVWRILRETWPRLRAAFSACTFCLQPRSLEDRPFELMFAPASIHPRFLKIDTTHFVDSEEQSTETEYWCDAFVNRILQPAKEHVPRDAVLWNELDEDPTTLRRFYQLDRLMTEPRPLPQALVGAMDLVESLVGGPDVALVSKRTVAGRAIEAATSTASTSDGVECLRLIEHRLRRTSWSRVEPELGVALQEGASKHTRNALDAVVRQTALEHGEPASWFTRGVLVGLRALALEQPGKLAALRASPELVRLVLTTEPTVGAEFIRVAAEYRDASSRAELRNWIDSVEQPQFRSLMRRSLISKLGPEDADLMNSLLRSISADEVTDVLDVALSADRFQSAEIQRVVIDRVAMPFSGETRVWCCRIPLWHQGIGQLFASTWSSSRAGLEQLLEAGLLIGQRGEALAAYFQRLGTGRLPYWVHDVVRTHPLLLLGLLDATDATSTSVTEQVNRILAEDPELPLSVFPDLIDKVTCSQSRPFFAPLVRTSLRALLPGYLGGYVPEHVARPFQEHPSVAKWFGGVDGRDLVSLLTRDAWSSSTYWTNAWRWLSVAPSTFYERSPSLLPTVMEVLLRMHHSMWSEEHAETWTQILRRSRTEMRSDHGRLALCVQTLKFCFENTRLPISSPVAETFHDVYAAVTAPRFPPEAAGLFSFFDWDKGKELRRALVDAFAYSQIWRPADLFLAASEPELLRKIFKRLRRKSNGNAIAQIALLQLQQDGSARARRLTHTLKAMIADPEFYEEWD